MMRGAKKSEAASGKIFFFCASLFIVVREIGPLQAHYTLLRLLSFNSVAATNRQRSGLIFFPVFSHKSSYPTLI